MTPPIVLTIAGSDPSAGAGIQADLKTISALGAYAATVITAVTTQNTLGVQSVYPLPPEIVGSQLAAVMDDLHPCAIKIGMVHDTDIVRAIADTLGRYPRGPVVYDPVMVSTSGCKLMEDNAIEALTSQLMPMATLITPNLSEAEVLTGKRITTIPEMEIAAKELLGFGSQAVLVKGGHLNENEMCDVLYIKGEEHPHRFSSPKIESRNTHGTGCTLSSAIATYLALGEPLDEAVRKAKTYVYQGILNGKDVHIGEGHGPLNHFFAPVAMRVNEGFD